MYQGTKQTHYELVQIKATVYEHGASVWVTDIGDNVDIDHSFCAI